MKKHLAPAAAALWMFLLLTSCGTGETPGSTARADEPSGLSSSGSIEADAESRQPEDTAPDTGADGGFAAADETGEEEQTAMKMNIQIGAYTFAATLADSDAAREFAEMMRQEPVTIVMDDYAGFEKVGPLGRSLSTSNSQTTTAAGDIVLYNGSSIVMFYVSNSWSYTRIGRVDDLTNWEEALGSAGVTAVFTLAE